MKSESTKGVLSLDEATPIISFSAEKGLGKEELMAVILDHISAHGSQTA